MNTREKNKILGVLHDVRLRDLLNDPSRENIIAWLHLHEKKDKK